MKLFMIRHGATAGNLEKRYVGRTDEGLTEQAVSDLKEEALKLNEKQQKNQVLLNSKAGQMTNEYIPGEERSFTIIAFPVPDIGEHFEEIFTETVKINTLDYHTYQRIQQTIIDALNQGTSVHILGRGKNKTDLTVQLHTLQDPEKETIFENCVADVNIPVGEVFTSPQLQGTNGKLHVTQVYLGELQYLDLEMDFLDGKIADYRCSNFDNEEDGKKYIADHVLHNHETLPMGEFAIGTNTTAYQMGRKYDIEAKLPILIAEKTVAAGEHFRGRSEPFCRRCGQFPDFAPFPERIMAPRFGVFTYFIYLCCDGPGPQPSRSGSSARIRNRFGMKGLQT